MLMRAAWMLLIAALAGPMGPAVAAERLPENVRAALDAAGIPHAALYAAALPLEGGFFARPWRVQAGTPVQPGSTMKLVTSVVALARLGPNHRGHTELRSAAPVEGGVLKGDLVLRGGADPDFSAAALWALLQELRAGGITTIEGDLLLDRSRFRPARLDAGLPPFDDAPEFPYNVIPDALNLAGSLLAFDLQATPDGAVATPVPPLPGVSFVSRMTPVAARCNDWDDHWQAATVERRPAVPGPAGVQVTLNGRFPAGCKVRAALQLIDRNELTESLFRSLWQGIGTPWRGRAREAASPAGARLLARRDGRPWGEHLRLLNKASDNPMTRVLFLELGVHEQGRSGNDTAPTLELAARSVQRWFVEHGIDSTGLVLDNGSGLSRSERVTQEQMVQMLKLAWHGPNAADLVMSLPVPGVDGTMRNRLRTSPAAGTARLKTGTLSNVVALAGYLRDPEGRAWAVSMTINHPSANARGRPVLDALVEHFVRAGPHGRAAARADVGPAGDGP
jgi:serine-type D-Ala-D-Ala carboxypeptidase/endopeptidase (penicillin-binding protein 4)